MKKIILLTSLTLLLSACSWPSVEKLQTPYSPKHFLVKGDIKNKKDQDVKYLADKGIIFSDAYNAVQKSETPENLKKYTTSGMSYANLLCSEFFDNLTYTKSHRDFAQKTTNLAGGLSSALLGLAQSKASVISAVGSIFGFGQATFNNYNESYIASPDIDTLRSLVKEKMKNSAIGIYGKLSADTSKKYPERIENFVQAESELNDYIEICTANGMRELVKESVDTKKKNLAEQNKTGVVEQDKSGK
ncbi:lipoprotein [uncultured Acinetobacter sp.]|uniref:lipoprotein n=1 Tax=uncultured Acinetobacter sp. TaxID=165433 RepID=UPI0025835887|nr:lipoprotein [uncultured Acinetobacter sp.]